jgi:L-lysine exporter family protein LysE/ArgO
VTRYGGAAFLLAYGIAATWRSAQAHQLMVNSGAGLSLEGAIATWLAFSFLNPHVYLDTVVLLGSLANQRGEHGRWMFGAGAVGASFAWFFALDYGARWLAPLFGRPGAWRVLDAVITLIMFGLGTLLLPGQAALLARHHAKQRKQYIDAARHAPVPYKR